jgi:hypothetical protein
MKIYLKGMGWDIVNLMWLALVSMVMNLLVSLKLRKFVSSSATPYFSRRTIPHGVLCIRSAYQFIPEGIFKSMTHGNLGLC